MPTKFCPHCGKRTGFQVRFNVSCRIGDEEEKAYLRECQVCGGRFITIQKDERMQEKTRKKLPPDELDNILGDHRRWLESGGTRGRRANLRCCDLTNRDLFGVNLKMAVIEDVDFSRTNLRTANLKQADFSYASLREIDFRKAQIFSTDFTVSDFNDADFTTTRLENVNFQGTNLNPKDFQEADCRKCTFD